MLAEKCKEVILLQDLPQFTGEEKLQEVLFSRPNVRGMTELIIRRLLKDGESLCGVEVQHRTSGEVQQIACDGLFVAIGLIPKNDPFEHLAQLDRFRAETGENPDWPFWNSSWYSPGWNLDQDETGVCWATLERNGAVLRIGFVLADEGYEVRAWRQERIWSEDTGMGNLWPGT